VARIPGYRYRDPVFNSLRSSGSGTESIRPLEYNSIIEELLNVEVATPVYKTDTNSDRI
jgi:hypothetical protein